jgi:hypothetical protein
MRIVYPALKRRSIIIDPVENLVLLGTVRSGGTLDNSSALRAPGHEGERKKSRRDD